MKKTIQIDIDLVVLAQSENERVVKRICEKLVDLQKLAIGEIDSITLQRDSRYVRVSTADYETSGGEVAGLLDDELEIVKHMLGVHGEGVDESDDFDSEDMYETVVFKTKIPTVQYVVYEHDGPWHGMSSEVYLRYDAPKLVDAQIETLRQCITPIDAALQLVQEVSHSMYSNYDECDMGDYHKLKRVEMLLGAV